MKLTRLIILALALLLPLGGCFVRTNPHSHHRRGSVVRCGPGTSWDGHKCRRNHPVHKHHHRGHRR